MHARIFTHAHIHERVQTRGGQPGKSRTPCCTRAAFSPDHTTAGDSTTSATQDNQRAAQDIKQVGLPATPVGASLHVHMHAKVSGACNSRGGGRCDADAGDECDVTFF